MHRGTGHHPNTSNIIVLRESGNARTRKKLKAVMVEYGVASRVDAVADERTPCSVELEQKTPKEQNAENDENRDDDDLN